MLILDISGSFEKSVDISNKFLENPQISQEKTSVFSNNAKEKDLWIFLWILRD